MRLRVHLSIAFHISNRYVDLEPVLANLAADAGMVCRVRLDDDLSPEDKEKGKSPSVWALLAQDQAHLGKLADNVDWKSAHRRQERSIVPTRGGRLLPRHGRRPGADA